MLWMMLACGVVSAQTTRSIYDGQPIRRSQNDAPTTQAAATQPASRSATSLDLSRVLLALAIVLGLILVLRWLARKLFPNAVHGRASDAIKVLSRSPITARQQILLVQVGRRVLVVADNGTQMTALSQIKDADEVAALVGQLNPSSASDREAFTAALDASQNQYEPQDEQAATDDASLAPAQTEIAGLMDKVRGLAKQLGR
jgi:flagellar biogenesis protein FliO